MERLTSETGEAYLDLGDEYYLVELSGLRSTKRGPLFAIKGKYPQEPSEIEQYRVELIQATITYFASTYPDVDIDEQLLLEKTMIVFAGRFPEAKSTEIATRSVGADRFVIDQNTREGSGLLDWHDGAIFIPMFE
jgi:hypothetical protein